MIQTKEEGCQGDQAMHLLDEVEIMIVETFTVISSTVLHHKEEWRIGHRGSSNSI